MTSRVPLSVLDLAPITHGSTATEAIRRAVDLARAAEDWGYRRYWLAEHHFVAVASSSTPTLIALVAAATERIRVGSAAVQLGHHRPASVVEAFGTIDALYPGRLDLGLGRSGQRRAEALSVVASGGRVTEPRPEQWVDGLLIPEPFPIEQLLGSPRLATMTRALEFEGARHQDFADAVDDVLDLLGGRYAIDDLDVRAVPGENADIEVWIFGSSKGQSAAVAGANGLPFVANYHVSPSTVLEAVEAYRSAFRPTARLTQPHVVVSADVVVAEDDATATHLASTYGHWVYDIRSGHGASEYRDPATAQPLTEQQKRVVDDRVRTQFVGSPATVAERLETLARVTGADELVITSVTHDFEDRKQSHRLLAQEWGLRPKPGP
ncbi:LLM class flavin-dependent oxidoreductase [Gordonia sp. OPL2]|uniref:LLM class flavin-dependent oxidoreductase n=1 Tax=Gordonia sp. OPL2 TaxID=2486274 RepID=UPI001656554F|nr:LLM class flavin-dependent oxidoreductase [Gordonia sp. OPL2]ROZ99384.1 LLM class flavin-dependent oxidoreductase [Gordonia sp. OPL2]